MTIARRRTGALGAIAAAMPSVPAAPVPAPGRGLPVALGDAPAPEVVIPAGRLRRCTFRRMDPVVALPGRANLPTYEVMCLYGGRDAALALGDIETARPVCEACTAPGIFRPDED